MKEGDIYLRESDKRLFAVALLSASLFSGEKAIVLKPLEKIKNESRYFVEKKCTLESESYSFQYNVYTRNIIK